MSAGEDKMCCFGVERTDECRRGGTCECVMRLPHHRRTDKITFTRRTPREEMPYSSERKKCPIEEENEELVPIPTSEQCQYFFGNSSEPPKRAQSPKQICSLTGDYGQTEIPRLPVRLVPEDAGDWTRFDVTSGILDGELSLSRSEVERKRSEYVPNDESRRGEEQVEKCHCLKPFCKTCQSIEYSSDSSGEVLYEKSVSFDDEILDAIDSEMWLNPVPRRKVLQFASPEHREKYKAQLLEKMKNSARVLPRAEWLDHVVEFDRYITVLMDESSEDSGSDNYEPPEQHEEKLRARKQRKKKRMMYSVEDIKASPSYYAKYVRQFMEFMEDLKKRAAEPPKRYWPRFMKIFSGYGTAADEEEDPEWLGLLLMAPSECFREISSSSSCESLPQMSDPGSTTTSLSSTECSPAACAMDSTERLRRAGVCVVESSSKEEVSEEETQNGEEELSKTFTSNIQPAVQSITAIQSISTSVGTINDLKEQLPPLKGQEQIEPREQKAAVSVSNSQSLASKLESEKKKSDQIYDSQHSSMDPRMDRLSKQATELFQSFLRARPSSKRKKPGDQLMSEEDEIIVIQEELLPSALGVPLKQLVEESGEAAARPEFITTNRNVIFIFRGKLYKMNYECSCGEICYCEPTKLVNKYISMLIEEIYGIQDSEEEEENDETDEKTPDRCSNKVNIREFDESKDASKLEAIQHSSEKNVKMREEKQTLSQYPRLDETALTRQAEVKERRFIRDADIDVDLKDSAILPSGRYDEADVIDLKASSPDGVVVYKDFYKEGELRGMGSRRKGAEKGDNSAIEDTCGCEDEATLNDEDETDEQGSIPSSTGGSDSRNLTISDAPESDSGSSQPLCCCCACEKKYEEQGLVYRRCDKINCSCCTCKTRIVKVAKKLHTRKKGTRFLYILLKKIRRSINKPSKETREQALQNIVNELRKESQRMSRKKWPFYFKETMIAAGLESASESTTVSEEDTTPESKKKKWKRWRYRADPKYSTTMTAADIQKREWDAWKAKSMDEERPIASYSMPQRAVLKVEDMSRWENSEAYYEYLGFILAMNDVIKGHSCKEKFPHSPNVEALLTLLNRFNDWIDDIPPIQQPQRFGNKAFRTWIDRLNKEGPTLLVELMPARYHGGLGEAQAYLLEGFGNSTRIDYGTGHEMAFAMFLCCLFKIGVFTKEDELPVVLSIFTRYLDVARKLQTVYKMEPAGSRGVWALDDFQFIPFLWGSSQLIGHPHIRPSTFLKSDIVLGFHDHYMFLACIKYINENKVGPFAEHSNQLWNISAVPTWDKVNSGLIKMYKGEVLCKFPVIQHVLFGSILPITPSPPCQTERVYTGLVREGLQPNEKHKPCTSMRPPQLPPPQQPVERAASQASSLGDEAFTEKFQNVPDPDGPSEVTSVHSLEKASLG